MLIVCCFSLLDLVLLYLRRYYVAPYVFLNVSDSRELFFFIHKEE